MARAHLNGNCLAEVAEKIPAVVARSLSGLDNSLQTNTRAQNRARQQADSGLLQHRLAVDDLKVGAQAGRQVIRIFLEPSFSRGVWEFTSAVLGLVL